MIVFTSLDRRADTILKPGIVIALLDSHMVATSTIIQCCFIRTSKFMQPVTFDINIRLGIYVLAKIKSQPS